MFKPQIGLCGVCDVYLLGSKIVLEYLNDKRKGNLLKGNIERKKKKKKALDP